MFLEFECRHLLYSFHPLFIHPASQSAICSSIHLLTNPSIHPLTNSSIHPSTRPSSQPVICPSIYYYLLTNPFIHPSFHHPSVYQSIHLSNHPSVHASIQPPICPCIYPTTHPSIHLSNHPSTHPSIHPSVHLSIHPSIYTNFLSPPIPSFHSSLLSRTLHFCADWYLIPLKFNHRVFLFPPQPGSFRLHPFSTAISRNYTDSFANNNSGELLAFDSLAELFYYYHVSADTFVVFR